MAINHKRRIGILKKELEKRGVDSFLVTNETNVSYLSGFAGHDSLLLVTKKEDFFITDSRYLEEAKESLDGFDIRLSRASHFETIKGIIVEKRLKRVGFESMNLPYEVASRLGRIIGKSRLEPVRSPIETMRAIKDAGEIELIEKAVRLTQKTLARIINMITPGISEAYLARKMECIFIESGARCAFSPIVASGANSSKPHARPTSRKIKKSDVVMVDMGCELDGYNADLTRMVMLGRVREKIKKIYTIVKVAQDRALELIRPGARISDVDAAARRHIEEEGYGDFFGHSVGHGIGMSVHEEPTISVKSEGYLRPGMVFTVEPAVYLPGLGGVRIEDMVLVTDNGCEILTR